MVIVGIPDDGTRRMNGPLAMAVQISLIKKGQAVEPDGDFGSISQNALRKWQQANGLPGDGALLSDQWERLTDTPFPSPFDFCLNVTADFEGTSFDQALGNFDGAGITFGLLGFTLTGGSLRRLLRLIEQMDQSVIDAAFGALWPSLSAVLDAGRQEKIAFADAISSGPNKLRLDEPWRRAFERLGNAPLGRSAQFQIARDVYWAKAQEHLRSFMDSRPLTDFDIGLWFDTAVQNHVDANEHQALLEASQQDLPAKQRRDAFANIIADHSSPRWHDDVLRRKSSFVDGRGEVHGSKYNLGFWGFSDRPIAPADLDAPSSIAALLAGSGASDSVLEPQDEGPGAGLDTPAATVAAAPGATGAAHDGPHNDWSDFPDFAAFFAGFGLTNFQPHEVLDLGEGNENGPCAGKNDYPARELWRNIGPTLAVLQKLRTELGAAITINSCYRTEDYNSCKGGSTSSRHMVFDAVDFKCAVGTPSTWAARLKDYRAHGIFKGGIGIYSTHVHLDTRGSNADWTG